MARPGYRCELRVTGEGLRMDRLAGDDREYLQTCRRVLAAGVLARDRAEVLAIEASRWPQAAVHLRDRIAAPGAQESPEAELEMLDFGHDLQIGLAETLERLIGSDARLAEALLQLQLDCARVRFVFEETAMRLREDPRRFAHAESHGRLLRRLTEAKVCMRSRRFDEARSVMGAFRAEAQEHAIAMDDGVGRHSGEAS
jgi:hypothetical protein